MVGVDQHDALLRSRAEGSAARRTREVEPFRVHQARSRRPRRDACAVHANTNSRMWCISPPRPACAIRSRIRKPMSTPTCRAFSMCWKAAGTMAASISSSRRRRRSMAPTPNCRSDVSDNVDHPISMYAASKKANELMAHSYAHLFRLPVTGLRFFTVYGPWGRPDMAMWIFAQVHPRRKADHAVQLRQHAARLHLCGRCRGIGRAA